MIALQDASLPSGLRIYAIGDVHGCLDKLERAHGDIGRDLHARPVDDWHIVHVGDYVDRGPDSKGVLAYLTERAAADRHLITLLGNHDYYLLDALEFTAPPSFETWMAYGGMETLASYGLAAHETDPEVFREQLRDAVPDAQKNFLMALPLSAQFGDYFFCHAGVRPTLPLERQDDRDLMWIREPFLSWGGTLEAVVVHGHTPVDEIAVRQHRIGIDTGAVFGGPLTCLVLERDQKNVLRDGKIEPLIR